MALIYLAPSRLKDVKLNDSVSIDGTALLPRLDTHGTNLVFGDISSLYYPRTHVFSMGLSVHALD